jgi:hypothetical protein
MMQDVHEKLIENCQGINGIQQEEDYILPVNWT